MRNPYYRIEAERFLKRGTVSKQINATISGIDTTERRRPKGSSVGGRYHQRREDLDVFLQKECGGLLD